MLDVNADTGSKICKFASTNLKFCTKQRGVLPLLSTKFQICRGKITGFMWSGDKNSQVPSNSAARAMHVVAVAKAKISISYP